MNMLDSSIGLSILASELKEGQARIITREHLKREASANLTSLLFDSVRESDIEEFIGQFETTQGVRLTKYDIKDNYEMYRPYGRNYT